MFKMFPIYYSNGYYTIPPLKFQYLQMRKIEPIMKLNLVLRILMIKFILILVPGPLQIKKLQHMTKFHQEYQHVFGEGASI